MSGLTSILHDHHKHCDDDFALAEEAARQGDWATAAAAWSQFRDGLLAHFGVEEEVLFPAFEQATGMVSGPPKIMRQEHAQMRGLLEQIDSALAQREARGFEGATATLLVMLQQHNMKEENILYPMCDRALQGDEGLRRRIETALPA
ncbi:MAG TPA: hemerythrin domain-containing protein [Candidatus Desulfobacillus sp.]|nr:hemerythrin domain-containing protein [Candidatus Desulfobacillus sp.]